MWRLYTGGTGTESMCGATESMCVS
jgi:hypothetical protein